MNEQPIDRLLECTSPIFDIPETLGIGKSSMTFLAGCVAFGTLSAAVKRVTPSSFIKSVSQMYDDVHSTNIAEHWSQSRIDMNVVREVCHKIEDAQKKQKIYLGEGDFFPQAALICAAMVARESQMDKKKFVALVKDMYSLARRTKQKPFQAG